MAPILFRCDANMDTGLGHLSRCIGLAEAFAEIGVESRFAGNFAPAAEMLLSSAGIPFRGLPPLTEEGDAKDSLNEIAETGVDTVIVDNYRISEAHLDAMKKEGAQVVVIDDFARFTGSPYSLLLNFTVHAEGYSYPQGEAAYLLGPKFFLTRRRLRGIRQKMARRSGDVRRLLIAIGGTDRHGLALRVVQSLAAAAPSLIVRVAVGAADRKDLDEALAAFPAGSAVLPNQRDLADEFTAADACISGGGLTKYECAYLGLPVAVLSQTEDQASETIGFAGLGLAFDLGFGPEETEEQLTRGVDRFLQDADLRTALGSAGRALFPSDPTMHAAQSLLEHLRLCPTGNE